MKVTKLLQEIEKLPALYIGDHDIKKLRHFLSGYMTAVAEYCPEDIDWTWGDFNNYLAEKYADNRTFDWAGLIQCHEPDGDTTDAFFRLLHEFYSHQKKQ